MYMGLDTNEFLLACLAAFSFISLVFYIIAYWRIYKKAGEKGWKSIIPFYRDYILCKISWKPKYFLLLLPFTAIYTVERILVEFFSNNLFGYNLSIEVISIISSICAIGYLVIRIILLYKLAKSFGKGILFTLGLIFFEVIFALILAFGKAEYVGVGGKKKFAAPKTEK